MKNSLITLLSIVVFLSLLFPLPLQAKGNGQEAERKNYDTGDIIQFILIHKLETQPTWLTGLTVSPSLSYQIAEGGEKNLSANLTGTYDFQEKNKEIKRLDVEREKLVQAILKALERYETLRVQKQFLASSISASYEIHDILKKRVESGLDSRQALWQSQTGLDKQNLEKLKLSTSLKAIEFSITMFVYEQRGRIKTMLQRWKGFE